MLVRSLALADFRSYAAAEVEFSPGLTAVVGANGQGKTTLLEGIGVAAGIGSIRGAADAAMVREGAPRAVIRCEVTSANAREVTLRAEIRRDRMNRFEINARRVDRRRDLVAVLATTVFSPSDLNLVQGEPAARRRWLDEALVATRPASVELRAELERILRQRNALLRQTAGRFNAAAEPTLDVWDQRLSAVGDELRKQRRELLDSLNPRLESQYRAVSRDRAVASAEYGSSWGRESLAEALQRARADDLRRATSTVGPHRDDVKLSIGSLPARSHGSQGEQRCMALALRLGVDALVRERRGVSTVLLLDDVLSEFDDRRAAALLESLPPGQCILTSASGVPRGVRPDAIVELCDGAVRHVRSDP